MHSCRRFHGFGFAGSGESGKSTIFKQMKILFGKGFQPDDRKQQVPVIHSNIISSMKCLIAAAEEMDLPITAQVNFRRMVCGFSDSHFDKCFVCRLELIMSAKLPRRIC